MNAYSIPVALAIAAMMIFAGCASQAPQPQAGGKLRVVASFYPMYEFSKAVGGERANVSSLIPPGVSPHEFEASPSAIKQLAEADVFVMNGGGLENWAPNMLEGVANPKLVVADAGKGVQLVSSEDADEPGNDPHLWLDPAIAKQQVENIRAAFTEADPDGAEYYAANAKAYDAKLDALDGSFRELLPTCRKKDILITHATLAYFCKEYGCNQIPVEGVNEEGEPSPADLASIVVQAREKNVTAVYFESLISPKSAETLASEIGAKALVFNTAHGITPEQEAQGESYLTLMRENLAVISEGLDCG